MLRPPSALTTGTTSRRIVFLTLGRGSGDLVTGLALAEGFRRAGVDVEFTILSDNAFGHLAEGIAEFIRVPAEPHLFLVADHRTRIYRELERLNPDLFIVFGSWVPVLPYIHELSCRTVLLMRQVNPPFLRLTLPDGQEVPINPEDYDLALTCEPNFILPGFQEINPIVIRNPDELLPDAVARARLGVPDGLRNCVIARNGYEGELEDLLARHGGREGWHLTVLTNKGGRGVFPLAEYAAGIDLLISGGGYATFYETRYLRIPAELEPFERNAEDIAWRLETNATYSFRENGADQFVRLVEPLLA